MGAGTKVFCVLFSSVLICQVQIHAVFYGQFGNELRDFIADFADINFKLFSKESLLVAGIAAPLYASAYLVDEHVHGFLYDESCHINTLPNSCLRTCFAEDIGIALPLFVFSGGLWCSHDYRTRLVGRNLLAGMVSIGLVKTALKDCLYEDFCYRPYSGCFVKKKVFGGFPSGHVAVLTYATVLLGLQKGAKWAIPVGAYTTAVITSVLICNYHYVSQIVAGAALGALYAVAANKLIGERMSDALELSVAIDQRGSPLLRVAYAF